MFAENRTLTNLFPSVTCLLRMYFALPCTATCEAECTFTTLRRIKNISDHDWTQVDILFIKHHSAVTDEINAERLMDVQIDSAEVRLDTVLLGKCVFLTFHDSSLICC